jgi:hypothetical protein
MTHTIDEQDTFPDLIGNLQQAGVRYLRTREELVMAQTRMLASFARGGIPSKRWKHLELCRGVECPHICSAACHFGEYRQLLELILPAQGLLNACGKPLWFVTVIDPRYFCEVGQLANLSINAMQQWLRRRIAKIEVEFGPVCALGGIEASFEIDDDNVGSWGPHFHFALASDAPRPELRRLLRPNEPLPRNFKPVVIKPITELRIAYPIATNATQQRAPHTAVHEALGTASSSALVAQRNWNMIFGCLDNGPRNGCSCGDSSASTGSWLCSSAANC